MLSKNKLNLQIRQATKDDFEQIWPIFAQIISAGETYPYPQNTTKDEARVIWIDTPHQTFIAESAGKVLGSYYIKANQPGLGAHVCNCGYMVSRASRGLGIATTMCQHSQQTALRLGYYAMQFNLVVSSNEQSIRLWKKLGFKTIGKLPRAFNHSSKGYIDTLIMYKWLSPE